MRDGSGRYGREQTEALLALRDPPTTIFATCDVLAAGTLQALYAARFRVPEDVSVIGFDDTLAINLSPAISSVAQPMRRMGAEAVRLAISALRGEPELETMVLPTWVVHRGSTAATR